MTKIVVLIVIALFSLQCLFAQTDIKIAEKRAESQKRAAENIGARVAKEKAAAMAIPGQEVAGQPAEPSSNPFFCISFYEVSFNRLSLSPDFAPPMRHANCTYSACCPKTS